MLWFLRRRVGLSRSRWRRKAPRREVAGQNDLRQYRESHFRCCVCHWPERRPGRRLEVHHVQGRRRTGRFDPRNLCLLCNIDHDGFHRGGKRHLTLGQVLQAKHDEDGVVDLNYLAWLRGKASTALELQPLPPWALAERLENAAWRSGT